MARVKTSRRLDLGKEPVTSSSSPVSSADGQNKNPLTTHKEKGIVIREPVSSSERLVLVHRESIPNKPRVVTDSDSSSLHRTDLQKIRDKYHLSSDIALIVPGKNWRASSPPVGWICIYEDQFRAGLRFPLHPFIRALLHHYQLPITQILPNGIRLMIKFLLVCGEHGVEPTVELFQFCFQIRKAAQALGYRTFQTRSNLRIQTPDNNSGWRQRFLYAQIPSVDVREDWNHDLFSDPRPSASFPPIGYEILGCLPEQDGRRVNETDLIQYGLSPAKLPALRKPTLRSTKQVVSFDQYKKKKTSGADPPPERILEAEPSSEKAPEVEVLIDRAPEDVMVVAAPKKTKKRKGSPAMASEEVGEKFARVSEEGPSAECDTRAEGNEGDNEGVETLSLPAPHCPDLTFLFPSLVDPELQAPLGKV